MKELEYTKKRKLLGLRKRIYRCKDCGVWFRAYEPFRWIHPEKGIAIAERLRSKTAGCLNCLDMNTVRINKAPQNKVGYRFKKPFSLR